MIDNEFGNDILILGRWRRCWTYIWSSDAMDNGENQVIWHFSPVFDDPQESLDDSGELVILKVVTVDGQEFLETIEDEDEMDEIADIFMERLEEDYDVVSDDEE